MIVFCRYEFSQLMEGKITTITTWLISIYIFLINTVLQHTKT
jgi:hypothetical protein